MNDEKMTELTKKIAQLYEESGARISDLPAIECELKCYLGFAFADNA